MLKTKIISRHHHKWGLNGLRLNLGGYVLKIKIVSSTIMNKDYMELN